MKVTLGLNEYRQCMFFALRMWYSGGKSTLDWRRAGRRDIGDYMSDHMQGKLAEVGFAKMLQERYRISAEVDLEVRPGIQVINETDVKMVTIKGEKRRPKMKIDVKATTPKSKYFLVDAREFQNRRYDAYVLVLVNLPKDHIIRFIADKMELPPDLKPLLTPLDKIDVDILGFTYRKDIETKGELYKAGEWLVDPENPKRKLVQLKVDNYGFPINELRTSHEDWNILASKL
ncbi:MAG: hypothetical protein QW222_01240 [Candidatus Bathyarchaeia archaeon]